MAATIVKQLALWAVGRMLPKEHVVEYHIKNLAKGIMLMVMGGLVVTVVFLGVLIGLHVTLTGQGIHPGLSIAIISTIALLGAIGCFMQADKCLNSVMKSKDDMNIPKGLPKVQVDVALQDGISLAVSSFLNGLRGRSPFDHTTRQPDLFDEDDEDIIHLQIDRNKRKSG